MRNYLVTLSIIVFLSGTSAFSLKSFFEGPDLPENGLQIQSFSCIGPVSCSFNGNCVDNTTCHCDERFATFQCDSVSPTQCCYKRKSRLTTFLLAFFLGPFGVNRFYLGENANALGFLFYTISPFIFFCCLLWPILCCLGKSLENLKPNETGCASCCLALLIFLWIVGLFCWLFYEFIASGTGYLNDWNGIGTNPDM